MTADKIKELEQKICYGGVVELDKNTLVWTRRDIIIGHDIYESKLKIRDIERIQYLKWFETYRVFSKHIKTKGLIGVEKEDKHTETDIDESGNRYITLNKRLSINSIEVKDKGLIEKLLEKKSITIEEI